MVRAEPERGFSFEDSRTVEPKRSGVEPSSRWQKAEERLIRAAKSREGLRLWRDKRKRPRARLELLSDLSSEMGGLGCRCGKR